MIRLNLMGGLGNQMFQYAFARALSEQFHDKEIEVNPYFSKYCNLWVSKSFHMTNNSLKHFQLNENVREAKKGTGMLYGLVQCVSYVFSSSSLTKRLPSEESFGRKAKKGIYQAFASNYYKVPEISRKNKYVTGYFANEKYFKNIKPILIKEFEVQTEPSDQNKEKIKELEACNSVCVHIRRGDYTSPKYSEFNICDDQYYQRGMDYIEQRVEKPVFYIFSNNSTEIAWIKEHYHFRQEVKYVDLNNPDYEELRLMYHCRHYVVSNSTFSWWGSYLSKYAGGSIVIAPSVWFKESFKGDSRGACRDDMVKLDVGGNKIEN